MKRTLLAGSLMVAFGAANASGLSWVEIDKMARTEVFGNPSGATGFVLTETPDGGGGLGSMVSRGYLTQATAGSVTYTFLGQESGFADNFKLTIAPGTTILDSAAIGTSATSPLQGAGILDFRFEGFFGSLAVNGLASGWCSTCSIGLIATGRTYGLNTYDFVIGYNDSAGANTSLGDWDDMVIGVNVTAVPEPETYAMLLAGLGLMGFVARRRQRKLAAA